MKLYLSSYRLGDEPQKLLELISPKNRTIGYVPNAFDFSGCDPSAREAHISQNISSLRGLGLTVEVVDLKNYFGKKEELQKKIDQLGAVWVCGGNVFVLRQAMKLSGFDEAIRAAQARTDFVYGGYSAGGCVLASRLDAYKVVDDSTDTPYPELPETVWEGLGIIDFVLLPHFQSDHPESADINTEVQYCIDNGLKYKTLRDGEVLIVK